MGRGESRQPLLSNKNYTTSTPEPQQEDLLSNKTQPPDIKIDLKSTRTYQRLSLTYKVKRLTRIDQTKQNKYKFTNYNRYQYIN